MMGYIASYLHPIKLLADFKPLSPTKSISIRCFLIKDTACDDILFSSLERISFISGETLS